MIRRQSTAHNYRAQFTAHNSPQHNSPPSQFIAGTIHSGQFTAKKIKILLDEFLILLDDY
jgi:hypothetical protein